MLRQGSAVRALAPSLVVVIRLGGAVEGAGGRVAADATVPGYGGGGFTFLICISSDMSPSMNDCGREELALRVSVGGG